MLGYDISWAGFNIIEVMSSPKFTHKRIGYLAASQCFHADSEVSHAEYAYWIVNVNVTICSYFFSFSAVDVSYEYDSKGFELTKSIRCWCRIKRFELLHLSRLVPRFGQRYYDLGKYEFLFWVLVFASISNKNYINHFRWVQLNHIFVWKLCWWCIKYFCDILKHCVQHFQN